MMFEKNIPMNRNFIIIPISLISVFIIVIFFIPLIDEFETFNCITPCGIQKITIVEKIQ